MIKETVRNKSFIFYESFHEAINEMQPEDALKAYNAITRYGLYNEEPNFDDNSTLKVFFKMGKPLIDSNMQKRANGSKGGRKPKDKDNERESQATSQSVISQKLLNLGINKQPIMEDDELPF
jgi:hypothetical protein